MCKQMQIKKNLAPLACTIRINQPKFTSRLMCLTLSNAKVMSHEQCIARKRPLTICVIKHTPRSEPKFHIVESLEGEGKYTNDDLIIFNTGEDLDFEINCRC